MVNETKLNTETSENKIKRIKNIIEQRNAKINVLNKQIRILIESNEANLKEIEELENAILFRATNINKSYMR